MCVVGVGYFGVCCFVIVGVEEIWVFGLGIIDIEVCIVRGYNFIGEFWMIDIYFIVDDGDCYFVVSGDLVGCCYISMGVNCYFVYCGVGKVLLLWESCFCYVLVDDFWMCKFDIIVFE